MSGLPTGALRSSGVIDRYRISMRLHCI